MSNTQDKSIRPTRKQKELLTFIDEFIAEHGYSPSYREIMTGKGYNSVATVALHINNLVKRGHLKKRDNSARSLEPVKSHTLEEKGGAVTAAEEKWLVKKVDAQFKSAEKAPKLQQSQLDSLYVLVGALKVLGLSEAANSFIPRLTRLKESVQ